MDLYDAAMVVIRRANLERFTATLVTGIIASVTLVVATEWTQKKRPGEQKITALTKNLNDSARGAIFAAAAKASEAASYLKRLAEPVDRAA
jgi:hypothetical protein